MGELEPEEVDALKEVMKYIDYRYGDKDLTLDLEEAEKGVEELQQFWGILLNDVETIFGGYFDMNNDEKFSRVELENVVFDICASI